MGYQRVWIVRDSETSVPEPRFPQGERACPGKEAVEPPILGVSEGGEAARPPGTTADGAIPSDVPHPADQDPPDLASMDLLKRAIQGDPLSIARLFFTLRPMIHRICRARLGHGPISSAADDVAQEALLAIFTALPHYELRHGVPFRAFAIAIAMRKVADAQRAAVRNRTDPVAQLLDRPCAGENPPEQHAMALDEAMGLRRLLQTLSPQQRAVLSLRIGIGLNANDTARALGMSAIAVRLAQHRALRALRSRLTDHAD